jgi:fucose permease
MRAERDVAQRVIAMHEDSGKLLPSGARAVQEHVVSLQEQVDRGLAAATVLASRLYGQTSPVDTAVAQRRTDILSLVSFVALGLPDGMLGTAWPSMRRSFGTPVGDLGLVLLVSTAGSVLVTTFVGSLIRRSGVAAVLATGLGCAAVAAVGFALAPVLGMILGVTVLFGLAAGMIDGGLNTAVGMSGRRRLLNLLHGAYGVGTAAGPLVVTASVLTGSWRPAYLALFAVDLGMAVLWARQRHGATAAAVPNRRPPAGTAPPAGGQVRGYRRCGVAAGIAVFFVYTGLEVSAGQWETTFNRLHLHLSVGDAGLAAFGYWAMLTAVRLGLGLVRRPIGSHTVVRWGSVLAVLATALIWAQPTAVTTILGFVLLGGFLAGVFPALIDLTPGRVGDRQAQHVIAWQVGAAAAGGAGISAMLGLLIGTAGLDVLGPSITVLALALLGAELVLDRLAPPAR